MAELEIYQTEAGAILLEGGLPLEGSASAATLVERARKMGAIKIMVSEESLVEPVRSVGLQPVRMGAEEKEMLDSRKVALMVEAKLAVDEADALAKIRKKGIATAEQAIREASSRPDLHLVNAIMALDDTDKFLNITATRTIEWYGLHFPELTQMMQDNMALCKMIADVGDRANFTAENLLGRGLTEKKIEAILTARERSKGGDISERDIDRVQKLAQLTMALSVERDKLNTYVESSMKRIAPNVTLVAGATIGARLMAKAGGLDRMATLPASTIQVLGAEKALFRALKTGARPPKHGILFQHQEVHTAPKWQRGKIARTIANKVAIAARIDCYRGSEEPSLLPGLDLRLDQIKRKYKDAPPRKPERRQKRNR